MGNVYSPTQLDFLRKHAAVLPVPARAYTQADVRALADQMLKDAAWFGSGGTFWDTDQGFAGNFSGYGGMLGSIGGGVGGAIAGTAAAPGVGTVAGGVAGAAGGGMAGRGLGYGIGSLVDKGVNFFSGNKSRPQPFWREGLKKTFDPTTVAMDGAFGTLGGIGRGVAQGGKFLARGLGWTGIAGAAKANAGKTGWQLAKQLHKRDLARETARLSQMELTPYVAKPGQSTLAQVPGRLANYGKNMRVLARKVDPRTAAGRTALLRTSAPLVAGGAVLGGLSGNAGALGNTDGAHFANTQGYTNVVGNKNRGLSGVTPLTVRKA
jgi:hypothetical protein